MNRPSVFIVLASRNGFNHISQQIDSLLSQSWPCRIYIFDDVSTDGSIKLITDKYGRHENIILSKNPKRLGYVKNFEQGIKKVYNLGAKFVALCDQDDIWFPNRLNQGMSILLSDNSEEPTLIFSDLQMINECGEITHTSYLSYRHYSLRTASSSNMLPIALGQNGVMGNTILMNRALIERILPFPRTLHAHDYWISLVAQLYGKCIFIPRPLVSYRIHSQNTSNSIQALDYTKKNHSDSFLKKLQQRDYRLPYKEDMRDKAIKSLLDMSEMGLNTKISITDQSLMRGFLCYLEFEKPRPYMAYWMLKNNLIRTGWKHKFNFLLRVILTKRYLK